MKYETPVLIAVSLATAALSFLALSIYLQRRNLRKSREMLEAINKTSRIKGPVLEGEMVPRLRIIAILIDSRYGRWLRQTASKAGIWHEFEFEANVSQKLSATIAATIASLFLVQTTEISIIYPLLLPVLAFFLPDLLLVRKSQARVAQISKSLPETIDLLGMCVSAGIGFQAGMQRVAMTVENPLSQEFSRVLAEMKLGRSRSQAMMEMAERLQIPSLTEFVNSVLQVDRLGVPMAKILEEQSRRMRSVRHEKAREQAQKLPVKILAPIMLFMMPALLIIVLGPAIVSIVRSFG